MTDLVAWLREQIAEDRRVAKDAEGGCFHFDNCSGIGDGFYEAWVPDRVLAECDAKERLLALLLHMAVWGSAPGAEMGAATAEGALRVLALPYADRPGYREEWKP